MEELVCGGWINSLLTDKEGTLALSSSLLARIWLVPRKDLSAVYSLREIMHANIVKIRLRVRSRPQDSAKERKKDRARAGVERDERQEWDKTNGMEFYEGTPAKEKNETPYTPSLLSFVYPLSSTLLAFFHLFARAPPRNPLGQTVFLFFSPFSTRKSLSRAFSPVFHRRRSPFLPGPKCCALPPRLVVDFQLKPEIRSNIRSRPRGEQLDAWELSVRFDWFREFFYSDLRIYEGWSR